MTRKATRKGENVSSASKGINNKWYLLSPNAKAFLIDVCGTAYILNTERSTDYSLSLFLFRSNCWNYESFLDTPVGSTHHDVSAHTEQQNTQTRTHIHASSGFRTHDLGGPAPWITQLLEPEDLKVLSYYILLNNPLRK
jgi:hypothetical protein